ncbi:MAG: sugar phosphate isomerase/epimerase [Lachnospiraceae bacterium]|nr:sugar phosphate isomerase/epimerase [Lachnospiraceae bacterium]
MKLGARAHDYGRHELGELAQIIAGEGFDTVQLALTKCAEGVKSFDDIDEGLCIKAKEALDNNGLECAVFGCYVDLAAEDPDVRKKAQDNFIKCMEFNRDIVKGSVVGSESCYKRPGKLEKRRLFPFFLESVDRICEASEKLDTDFAIEPVAWHVLEDVWLMRELLDKCDCSHFHTIFDLANVLDKPAITDQKNYWRECFSVLGDSICAIHLKDIQMSPEGSQIQVLIGEGLIDYSVLREWLRDKPDMPVLREGIHPESAAKDIEQMRKLWEV